MRFIVLRPGFLGAFRLTSMQTASIDMAWKDRAENGFRITTKTGSTTVRVNPKFYCPAEFELLIGDLVQPRRIRKWQRETKPEELRQLMHVADLAHNPQGLSS